MNVVLSLIKLNHHNIKQHKRKELFDILKLILKNTETIPHCSYLNSYIKTALECFMFTKSRITNNIIITIVNKNKLRNIITFVSKKDCYGIEYMNKLSELCYHI